MGANEHKGWYSRGYLPHCDEPYRVQMITIRLADSLPIEVMKKIEEGHLGQPKSEKWEKIDEYLDLGHGSCHLADPRIATVVENALLYFDDQRYNLVAWVIMPNHVHSVIEILEGFSLVKIIHSWKSYSANIANKVLGRKGVFWQPEYFDRFMRNADHLENAVNYIHANPIKAGLVDNAEDWPFSSARLFSK